jgi:hypothetical protein
MKHDALSALKMINLWTTFYLCLTPFIITITSRKIDGTPVPLGTVKSGTVQAANDKEVMVITITAEKGEKYSVKDGTVWYRLAASNYKQTTLPTIYTEKELEVIVQKRIATQTRIIRQQCEIEYKGN